MEINVGDMIETKVGGPYKVLTVNDNLIVFKIPFGIGQTITQHVTKIIKTK